MSDPSPIVGHSVQLAPEDRRELQMMAIRYLFSPHLQIIPFGTTREDGSRLDEGEE